jgi:hypothetical protein
MAYDIHAYSFRPAQRTKRICSLEQGLSLWLVLPLWKNREMIVVEQIGYYFKREMHYDFSPYSAESRSYDNHAYLFGEHRGIHCVDPHANIYHAVGAAGFTCPDKSAHILEWVWLHPYIRRCGVLKSAWPAFESRHSDFAIRSPVSQSMELFLESATSEHPHERA